MTEKLLIGMLSLDQHKQKQTKSQKKSLSEYLQLMFVK